MYKEDEFKIGVYVDLEGNLSVVSNETVEIPTQNVWELIPANLSSLQVDEYAGLWVIHFPLSCFDISSCILAGEMFRIGEL